MVITKVVQHVCRNPLDIWGAAWMESWNLQMIQQSKKQSVLKHIPERRGYQYGIIANDVLSILPFH